MIQVELPAHLRTLAGVKGEVTLDVAGPVTLRSVLDALEAKYPTLEGTIREHGTLKRRAFLRFFACEEDLSHESPDALLPALQDTAHRMETIRAILGHPIIVTSGYRSPAVNKIVGGSECSAHMEARAVDFICPAFGSPRAVCGVLKGAARFDQLILKGAAR